MGRLEEQLGTMVASVLSNRCRNAPTLKEEQ